MLSWNVEHFKLEKRDVPKIISHINKFDPDVLAIYEVTGKDVYDHMMKHFPNHSFFITEGPQSQEILVGTRNTLHAFTTQRTEFKSSNTYLRPGTFSTFQVDGIEYSLLFLHTKSMTAPVGFGIRDDQFQHAFDLKKKLDTKAGGKNLANFVIMGDLNTMGMTYPFKKSIGYDVELQKLGKNANLRGMHFLKKDFEFTWTNGKSMMGNLDHVIASNQIKFKKFDSDSEVNVSGWRETYEDPDKNLKNKEFKHFVSKVSDHNSLYFEIHV
ncbi:hypothetical protein YTPLAS73_13590 [Nitrosarchaeum sp.]|nr:hypothetical protein YTPLAS73_13590 [Nitrosarchaeum sp.]